MQTLEDILREFMKHGFERMCIIYERLGAKVCFFFFFSRNHVYSSIYINVDTLITIYFYVCRWKMKGYDIKKQVDQENMMLKNQSTR